MIALLLLACSSAPEAPAPLEKTASRPADAPPNVVILLADDAGFADFGLNGSEHFATPAIDQLAADGVRFEQAYVTAPVCSPSRAGLLTGRYQQRFGHEANPPVRGGGPNAGLHVDEKLLSDHLAAAGYATGAFGKWHLGSEPHFLPNARGFDRFVGVIKGERTYFPQDAAGPQAWRADGKVVDEDFAYVTDAIADATLSFMDAHQAEPFFAYVAFTAVHAPLEAKPEDLAAQPEALQGHRRKLAAMTTAMDRAVGRILDGLDQLELTDDTLVVFLNDNGAGPKNHGDNSPWRGGKGRLFDGGIRTPFVLRWPGVAPEGARRTGLVSSLDVVPTVLHAAGVSLPTERPLDGRDLAPLARGATSQHHERLMWRLGPSWAIRDGRFKLLSDKGSPPVLYDLTNDPAETVDRIGAHPEEAGALQDAFDRWNAELSPPAFLSATELRRRNRRK